MSVGDRLAGACDVQTLHPGNRIVSMQSFLEGTPIPEGRAATKGMHVAIQCETDNGVQATEKCKWHSKLDEALGKALANRTMEAVPPFGLLSKANRFDELAGVPVYLVLHVYKDCPFLKNLKPHHGVFLEARGGHSIAYVAGVSAPLKKEGS